VVADPFFLTRASQIVAEAARQAIPTMSFGVAGGLISYATSRDETFRKLGEYTGRILKGVKPADLPITSRPNSNWRSISRPRRHWV
jgi:putative tryptophan/tyrosine transport system substrate-binding protein